VADALVLVAAAFVLRAGIKGAGHSVLHTRLAISVSEGGVPPPGGVPGSGKLAGGRSGKSPVVTRGGRVSPVLISVEQGFVQLR